MNGEDVTEVFDWLVARRQLFWAGGRAHPQYTAASPLTASRMRARCAHAIRFRTLRGLLPILLLFIFQSISNTNIEIVLFI